MFMLVSNEEEVRIPPVASSREWDNNASENLSHTPAPINIQTFAKFVKN